MSFKLTKSQVIENNNQKLESMDNLQRQQQSKNTNQSKFARASQLVLQKASHQSHKTQKQQNWTNYQKRQKIPGSLKRTLQQRAKQSGKFHETSQIKKSKFGQIISSKIKRQIFVCGICYSQIKQKQKINLCKCQHIFCSTCLNQYVLYKIGMFQEIPCPNENCDIIMSQQTNFYKNLPETTKQKYLKIHNFYATANDPTLKLCPRQECDGIIKIIENQPRICDRCQTQFCPKCYFKKHQGDCDKNQVDFFQNNLHYRQCSNCKFVVERTEGCNHMTCRCKHQFCYICGGDWSNGHLCNNGQGGGVQAPQQPCCDCTCCDEACGPFACIFKFPFKLILEILFLIVVLLVFVNKLMILVMLLVFVLLAGIFFFSIDFICTLCDQDKCGLAILLILFFPIAMIIGIFIALKEVLCEVMSDQMRQAWDMLIQGSTGIWNM